MSKAQDGKITRIVSPLVKAKGAVQMAAGTALAVAGIPLCALPGPGVAAIAGGVALASKGQRTYSGRPATKIEQKLDAVAARVAAAVRREAAKTARSAGEAVTARSGVPGLMEKDTPSTAFKGRDLNRPTLIGKYCWRFFTSTRYSFLDAVSLLMLWLLSPLPSAP